MNAFEKDVVERLTRIETSTNLRLNAIYDPEAKSGILWDMKTGGCDIGREDRERIAVLEQTVGTGKYSSVRSGFWGALGTAAGAAVMYFVNALHLKSGGQ